MAVKIQEIIALKQLIGKFGERKSVARLTIETLLHAILCHHVVNGDMFSYVAYEIQETIVLCPIVIVQKFRFVGSVAVKVEEMRQLLLYTRNIVCKRFLIKQVALLAFTRRVANHACCSANNRQRFVSRPLQMSQHHYSAKMTYVKTVGCGVYAHVCRYHSLVKQFVGARHHLMEHTAPFDFVNEIHRMSSNFNVILMRLQSYYKFVR